MCDNPSKLPDMKGLQTITRLSLAIAMFSVAGWGIAALVTGQLTHTVPLVLAALAGFSVLDAAVLSIVVARVKSREEWLRQHGRLVSTDVQETVRDDAVPQGSTYRIVTRWHNHTTGLHHTFVSEPVPFDPAPYLTGRPVSVWLDPDKPKRYVMDITFLADAHARATG